MLRIVTRAPVAPLQNRQQADAIDGVVAVKVFGAAMNVAQLPQLRRKIGEIRRSGVRKSLGALARVRRRAM